MPEVADKQALRSLLLASRRALPAIERSTKSAIILSRLAQFDSIPLWLSYRALPDEVETAPLFLSDNHQMFAPITLHANSMCWQRVRPESCWQKGNLSVLEPSDSGERWQPNKEATLLIAPLVGFDRNGGRLGMGLGCFDRWLAANRQAVTVTVGLAFSCQEAAALPQEPHDMPLDYIFTENEEIRCLRP